MFKAASPSVVHITTHQVERDFFSLDVYKIPRGSVTGFVVGVAPEKDLAVQRVDAPVESCGRFPVPFDTSVDVTDARFGDPPNDRRPNR